MKKYLLLCLLSGGLFTVMAQDKPVVVSVSWLKEHQQDPNLVILQPNFLRLDYEREHIAGARFLWPAWLAPDSPEGSMNIPDLKQATEVLQSLGINNDSHIVLCHIRNEVSVTARMFLMLEYLGLRGKVSYLNGGLEAWKKEGLPVTKEVAVVKKGNYKIKAVNPVVVDRNFVLKNLDNNQVTIVDARLKRFYDGDPTGNPRDGHIKGAANIPYTDLVDASNLFKPTEELQPLFTPIPSRDKEVVAYCFIGQTASVVYLAGRILGYDMKVYDGSMQEWSRIEELPMEVTPKQ
jgi:thiosulfate/3-mercaptopyruvate sulfurtransferase